MLKVAIINYVCAFGSTGKITVDMYEGIKQAGHDARVYYGVRNPENKNDKEDFIYFGNRFFFLWDHILSNLTGLSGALSFFQTKKLFRELKRYQPDIIWLYNLHGGYVHEYKLLDYAKKHAKWTLYSMADEYPFLGKCCYSYDCEKYRDPQGCHHCPQKKESPRSLIFDRSHYHFKQKEKAYKDFDKIIFFSAPYIVDKAKKSWLLKDKEYIVTDTSVDIAGTYYPRETEAVREKLGIPEENKVMILCAPLSRPDKGVKYFLQAAELCKDDKITFVNVGFGGDPALCPSNYLALDYVRDQNYLAELLSLADAYVCTSIADAQPNACLNALGCGTPVIGFNVSGVPFVAPNEFGTFVPPFDVEALAEAIRKAPRRDPEKVEACHRYALDRFGIKPVDPDAPTLWDDLEERIQKAEQKK